MQVTLKLYAQLGVFLPPHAARNEAVVEVADGTSIWAILDAYNVPRASCHLVLINGHFKAPAVRDSVLLQPGDHIAVWPPVAGG
jgi:molybdopterin converting factor small subunit